MKPTHIMSALALCSLLLASASGVRAQTPATFEYRVLATTKTSTMEKELNAVGEVGFRFQAVTGGETAIGGKEVVCIAARQTGEKARYEYRLLATSKTSTMQTELQDAAEGGFEYRGQTVFESVFGGKEVVSILERNRDHPTPSLYQYKLLSTTRTSTMEKELKQAGDQGFEVVGMTVGKTLVGGAELVTITRKKVR